MAVGAGVNAPSNKAEKLALAADVAPLLRRRAGRGRSVTLVGKDGAPVGTVTDIDIAKSLLARSEIEFDVLPGKRPAWVSCKTCKRPVEVQKLARVPVYCRPGTHSCPCGKVLTGGRGRACLAGKKCRSCTSGDVGRTEQRNAALEKARLAMTREQRAAAAKKARASDTEEQKKERSRRLTEARWGKRA